MRDCADLSRIDSKELHEADVWAGYLSGAATKICSDNDWRRVADFPKLPIVVARPGKTGQYCGQEAILAIYKLGIPSGTAIAFDPELESGDIAEMVDVTNGFADVLHHFHYDVVVYGSVSWLFDIPMHNGYWVATDSKIAEQYHHPGVHGTQYLFGDLWDESLVHRHWVHSRLAQDWKINHSVG